MIRQIAKSILARAETQSWHDENADALALECAVGACMASSVINGKEHGDTNALILFAFVVSVHGMSYVKERANDPL